MSHDAHVAVDVMGVKLCLGLVGLLCYITYSMHLTTGFPLTKIVKFKVTLLENDVNKT